MIWTRASRIVRVGCIEAARLLERLAGGVGAKIVFKFVFVFLLLLAFAHVGQGRDCVRLNAFLLTFLKFTFADRAVST